MLKTILAIVFIFLLQEKTLVEINNPWVRVAAKGMNSALYFEVENNLTKPDTLYNAKCDLAEIVEIHETFTQGDRMGMRRIEFVEIEPGTKFQFRPRAHHIMLIGLKEELEEGKEIPVFLYFKESGEVKLRAVVRKMM